MCRLKDVIILMLNKSGKVKNKNKKQKSGKITTLYFPSICHLSAHRTLNSHAVICLTQARAKKSSAY